MKTRSVLAALALGLAITAGAASPSHAHRAWLLPSATILSGEDPWITADAAISNDLFYFEHHALPLDGLFVIAPDGSKGEAENQSKGRYRSTFDVHLTQQGTYRIGVESDFLTGRYKLNGETKRWRGTEERLKEIPAEATDVRITHAQRRLEFFATAGNPTETALKPTGKGLELAPVTHPNDLFAGEAASFVLLLDGKPAADLEVSVIPGGIRYRDQLNEVKGKTDGEGQFSVKWPEPGMYWISASADAEPTTADGRARRASYAATLEVISP